MDIHALRQIVVEVLRNKKVSYSLDGSVFGVLLHSAQLKHLKRKIGLPEDYSPGVPISRQVMGISRKVIHDLAPFMVSSLTDQVSVGLDADGAILLPDDYFYFDYLTIFSNGAYVSSADFVTTKEYNQLAGSSFPVTINEPVAMLQGTVIKVLPSITGYSFDLGYIKMPAEPVYAVDSSLGYNKYNSGDSVDLEWDDVNKLDILAILLSDMGVIVGRDDIVQVNEKVKAQGI